MSKYKLTYYGPDDTCEPIVEMTDEEAIILRRILTDANKQVENSYVGIVEVGEKNTEKESNKIVVASYEYEHNDGDQIWSDTTTYYQKNDGTYEKESRNGYYGKSHISSITLEEIVSKMDEIKQEVAKKQKAINIHGYNSPFTRGGYSIIKNLSSDQKIQEKTQEKIGVKYIKEYTINIAALFGVLTGFDSEAEYVSLEYEGYIQKETDGDNEWFDLKTDNGTPCMDGETCKLLEETEDYVVLQEETEQIPFKLSRKEFEIAATLNVA